MNFTLTDVKQLATQYKNSYANFVEQNTSFNKQQFVKRCDDMREHYNALIYASDTVSAEKVADMVDAFFVEEFDRRLQKHVVYYPNTLKISMGSFYHFKQTSELMYELFKRGYTPAENVGLYSSNVDANTIVAVSRPASLTADKHDQMVESYAADYAAEEADALHAQYFSNASFEKYVEQVHEQEKQAQIEAGRKAAAQALENAMNEVDQVGDLLLAAKQQTEVKTAELQAQFPDLTVHKIADILASNSYEKKRKSSGSVWVLADADADAE